MEADAGKSSSSLRFTANWLRLLLRRWVVERTFFAWLGAAAASSKDWERVHRNLSQPGRLIRPPSHAHTPDCKIFDTLEKLSQIGL